MQLKLVTFDKHNHSVSTQFLSISTDVSIEYRSLSTHEFSLGNTRIPSTPLDDVIAFVIKPNRDNSPPLPISKHQGAYLIDAGKTVEIINQPVDFEDLQIWVFGENSKFWVKESLACYMDSIRQRRKSDQYKVLPIGEDPHADTPLFGIPRPEKPIGEMVTVTWYRDRRHTSKTWRKWDEFAKTLDTRDLETIVVREDNDPNHPSFKLP